MKKTELAKRIVEMDTEVRSLRMERSELEKELSEEKRKVEDLTGKCNERADRIGLVINILSGEASPESKSQVLRDLFLDQIKEIEERRGRENGPYQIHSSHLSDRVNSDTLAIF